jgi:hypothetical protein
MTKKSDLRLIRDAEQRLPASLLAAVEAEFKNTSSDNSPRLDALILRDTVETVSALNLSDLALELEALCEELPLLSSPDYEDASSSPLYSRRMAVAFEAGRRYMLLEAVALLTEEVSMLPTEAYGGEPTPLLEA